jgi:hypothetical protein
LEGILITRIASSRESLHGGRQPIAAAGKLFGEVEHFPSILVRLLLNDSQRTRPPGANDGRHG